MTRAQTFNAVGVLACLGLAGAGAASVGRPASSVPPENASAASKPALRALTDARGEVVPVAPYRRIVSLNTVADVILLELVEPERLVGVSAYTLKQNPVGYRFGATAGITRSKDLEPIIALRPDLVIVTKFADESYMTRLRELEIEVFDLGEMRGVQDTKANIETLARLLDEEERGQRISNHFMRNLAALETAPGKATRPWGIYLNIYGDTLLGGTKGSSYADLLHYGGLRDLAEDRGYLGWPRYSPEQILELDPPVIVTGLGRKKLICGHALLDRLSACHGGGQILELPENNHSDPGLGLVDAAQDLQTLVHGRRPRLEAHR